jgi:hypothetical protein
MKSNENQNKENDREDKWHARMNDLESLWLTRMAETRIEYQDNFNQATKKRSESELPRM